MRAVEPLDEFPRARVVDGEWSDPDAPLDLLSNAVLLGARTWTERELHRLVGAWARTSDDRVAVLADRLAMGHARRADVLYARLPQLRELPADSLVAAPGERTARVVAHLGQLDDDHVRLAAWTEVSAALIGGYRAQLGRATPVADAPLLRCLPLLLDELALDRLAAEAVLDVGGGAASESVDGGLAALIEASEHLTA